MLDLHTLLGQLRRPRLLVRAARHGLPDYRRERDLPRLLQTEDAPRSAEAVMRLLMLECEHEEARSAEAADYLYARHIGLLIAIMAEARLLAATRPTAVP